MKKIFNFVKNFIMFVYILLIIFVTICLLSYNDYKITVFGETTLIPIIDDNLEPDYTIGDLVIVEKSKLNTIREGDIVFFYRTFAGEATINYAKITGTERATDTQYTFTVEGDYRFSSDYYIGNTDSATIIPKVGTVLKVLESKWGFLFLGVFPSLVAFLYTLYSIIAEVRYKTDDDEKEESITEKIEKDNKEEKEKVEDNNNQKTEEQENNSNQEIEEQEENSNQKIEEQEDKEANEKNDEKEQHNDEQQEPKSEEPENKDKNEKQEQDKEEVQKEEQQVKTTANKEKTKTMTEEQKKALIEAKLKSMTEEQKKALIEAKLKSMTDEEKKALIEAKKKKLEEQKNK